MTTIESIDYPEEVIDMPEAVTDIPRQIGGLALETAAKPLTFREIEVLDLASRGLTNPRTGESLYVSKETIKTHRRHIIKKLGANNMVHAIRLAIEQGFLPIEQVEADISLGKDEFEVLDLFSQGLTTEEVATRRGVTTHTVNTQRKAIFNKLFDNFGLEPRNIRRAVRRAFELGIFSINTPETDPDNLA